MARLLIGAGLVLVAVGALWAWAPRALGWIGHLPGDLRIETRQGVVYVPLASMLVVSLVLSGALRLVGWIVRRLG